MWYMCQVHFKRKWYSHLTANHVYKNKIGNRMESQYWLNDNIYFTFIFLRSLNIKERFGYVQLHSSVL